MSSYGTATAISLFIILSVAPGDLRAGAVLDDARALLSEQRYEDVSTLLADASVEPSEEPARRLYLGVALRSLDRRDDAIEHFLKGLETESDLAINLRLELAVTYSWEKRLDEALHQYELVLETDPGHLAAASGRARMLHWQGDVDAAARSYRQVLAIAPGHIEARLGLAATEVESLNLTDARDHYQEVLTAAPENPDAREGLRRLDEITRTRLAGRIGVALLDDTRAVTGHATVSYQWTRRWTVFGEYGVQAFSPGDAFAATPDVIVHRASAGAALRLDNKWTLAAAPTVQAADGQWHLGLAATAAFTPVEPLTLMVSARPGWTLDGRGDLLSWIGGEWRISPRWSASVQYFHYDDFASQRADAGVAKLAVQVLAPWRTEAGGGVEWRAGRPAWTAWSENRFAVARTVDLVFRYGFYHGVFDRHEMEAGVAVRF